MNPGSRRPHTVHRKNPKIVKMAMALRKRRGWGPDKISGHLKSKGISIDHRTVYRYICRDGLNNPLDGPRKTWGKKRFERSNSNSLWQADFKLTEDDRWMLTFMDDHSRFVLGVNVSMEATTEVAIKLFRRCGKRYGFPEQVLTDRGTQFYCPDHEGKEKAISLFAQILDGLGIKHIVASKHRPTTIGKVERFHRTYDEERRNFKTLGQFLRYYNYHRPNQGINYLVPAQVYFRDMKNV